MVWDRGRPNLDTIQRCRFHEVIPAGVGYVNGIVKANLTVQESSPTALRLRRYLPLLLCFGLALLMMRFSVFWASSIEGF